jgi:Arc/MetJ family transcription regulator
MSRTNIDLDDAACAAVMERYNLGSKRDAVNLALRRLASEPLDVDDARSLRGSGWDGDLDQMRASRAG